MLALLYILLCALFGITLTVLLIPDVRRLYLACAPSRKIIDRIPNTLFIVPTGVILGLLCVTFFNYFVTLGMSYIIDSAPLAMKLGAIATFTFFTWLTLSGVIMIAHRRTLKSENTSLSSDALSSGEYHYSTLNSSIYGISTILFTAFAAFLMYYTYRIESDTLLAGYSTFSDLSPHTAMVSSFGVGFNFPTQFMHYSGDGIQYHFLFYFLCGMLEYLGLPIDSAINIPSVITMVCAFVLLGLIAVLISGKRLSFLFAPILVLFRSSLNVFYHLGELLRLNVSLKDAINSILHYDQWYEVTDYDAWGIWAINVYPNQRHLMLGVSVILILIILFLPFLRRMCITIQKKGFSAFVAGRNAWLPRSGDPLNPWSLLILAGILVVVLPYFHGSCLITALIILAFMAVFSESRLLHIIIAVAAVASSFAQVHTFSGGASNVISFKFAPGFILTPESQYSIASYLLIVTGLTLIVAFICAVTFLIVDIVKKKPIYRSLLFVCFISPALFAFLFQVTEEMLANHKYIQISLILCDVFVAIALSYLFSIPFKKRSDYADKESEAKAAAEIAPASENAENAENAESAESAESSEVAEAAEDSGVSEVSEVSESESSESETSESAIDTETAAEEPAPEPKNVVFGDEEESAMRPGNIALKESADASPSFVFGDVEEPIPSNEAATTVESSSETTGETPIGELKHAEIPAPKEHKKGLPLVAWIALQVVGILLGIALLVPLTATGVSEWATYINLNSNAITVNLNSPLTKWVIENTDPSDVFLTPMWSMNRFLLAGRPMYYGWPYFAWSEGHDTDTRDTIYCWLMTGCNGNIDEFVRYCKERGIRYLIDDPDFNDVELANGIKFNRSFFEENLTQAAYFAEENTTVYRIY